MSQTQQHNPTVSIRLDKSRAQRFIWLLEECSVDYDIEILKRTPEMQAPPELKKIHPLGKSPVIKVAAPGRTDPLMLAESGFITEYLTDNFAPHLAPKKYEDGKQGPGLETEEWLRYHFFMHYAEGSLMALMVTNLIFSCKQSCPSHLTYLTY
jgi:glutathione S-transferase